MSSMRSRAALAFALTAWLAASESACTVGPDYARPAEASPDRYAFDSERGGAAPSDRFWTAFGDPALDRIEARVLAENRDIAAAVARIDEARGIVAANRADLYPSLYLTPAIARARTSGDVGDPFPHLNTTLFSLPVSAAYEVDLWGKVRRSVNGANELLEADQDAAASLRISIAAEAAADVLQIRAIDRQDDVLLRSIQLRQQLVDLSNSRFRAGTVSALDVETAKTELETTLVEQQEVRRQRELMVHALAVLADQPAPAFSVEAAPDIAAVPVVYSGLPSELLERRPDVAASERQLAAASEQIGIAKAAFFPSLTLTAGGGVASQRLSDLVENRSITWSVGPAVSLPLFDGGRNRAGLQIAQARYQQSLASYQKSLMVAFNEVQDALSDTAYFQAQSEHLGQAFVTAQSAERISKSRYERGLVSYLEVLDAERTALDVELAVVQNRRNRLIASLTLMKALGGGWRGLEGRPGAGS